MNLQKINWKVYFSKIDPSVTTETWFRVFNEWIPGSPEVFVDVADYSHVSDGPKIILVGHYVDVTFDHTDRKYGFLYGAKHDREGSDAEKIKGSFGEFIRATQKLLNHPLMKGKVEARTDEFLFVVNDRGGVPNTAASFAAVKPLLESALKTVLGDVSLSNDPNPKIRFNATVKVQNPKPLW